MYDRTTVQGATFDMRGQLYRGHALGSESDDPGSSSSWDKLCGVKKNASSTFRLG